MAEGKLRSASQLTVHTGNILKHKDKPIRLNASPEEEVESGLKHTLQKWNETSDNSSINSNHIAMNSIHVHDSDCCSRLDGNSVEDLTITLKVFINCGNDKVRLFIRVISLPQANLLFLGPHKPRSGRRKGLLGHRCHP